MIERVLGNAVLRDPSLEQAKYPVVRYAGQPIAAVAATTPYAAEEAAAKVKVKYEALPFVVDLDVAREASAPLVFPGAADQEGNRGRRRKRSGAFRRPAMCMGLTCASRATPSRDSRTPT